MTAPLTDAQAAQLREAAQKAHRAKETGSMGEALRRMGLFHAIAAPATILALLDERERLKVEASNHAADAETVRRERDAEYSRRKTSEAIVDRIWDIFGRPSYDELAGRSIYDLVTEVKAERDALRAERDAATHSQKLAFELAADRLRRAEAAEADVASLRARLEVIENGN